jgi:small subunit ribosomal protein S20
MANSRQAEKRHRQSLVRRDRNRSHITRMRTAIKKLRQAVEAADTQNAQELLVPTLRVIDMTAQRGVIHGNTAARYKSRLSRAVGAIAAS